MRFGDAGRIKTALGKVIEQCGAGGADKSLMLTGCNKEQGE